MKNKTISKGLVGANASLQNGIYSDDYLEQINQNYRLQDVLGKRIAGISEGNWIDLDYFTMGSPLGNSEGEQILNGILFRSANNGLWQPKIIDVGALTDTDIKTAEEYLKSVETISPSYNRGMMDGGVIFGIAVAQRGGFVLPTIYENNVVVLPTQKFLDYCSNIRQ